LLQADQQRAEEFDRGKQMESHHPRRCIKARRSEWKEKLREGCLSRVRENRHQLLWKIRLAREATEPKEIAVSAFEQIISDELQKSKQSCHGDSQSAFIPHNDDALWDYEPSGETRKLDKDEYEEILLEMERLLHDDIQAELKQRDAALLEDYEKTCALEEESVAAALFEHLKIQEQNGGLFCPICRKGYLNQQRQFIYCECCQLKLDTQNDEVDLQVLQKHLSDVLEEHHGRGCKAQPKFCVESRFEISALFMKCSVCEAFELVL